MHHPSHGTSGIPWGAISAGFLDDGYGGAAGSIRLTLVVDAVSQTGESKEHERWGLITRLTATTEVLSPWRRRNYLGDC